MKSIFLALLAVLFISSGAQAATPPADQGPVGCPYVSNASCGIPVYPSGSPYALNQLVSGSDGNIYRSVVSTNVADPASATECGVNWTMALVWFPKTVAGGNSIAVPSKCPTVANALSFVGSGSLLANVQIHPADGTYSFGTTSISLNYPSGSQIDIIGNTSTKANVVFNFTGVTTTSATPTGLFLLTSAHQFGTIDGLIYNGPGAAACNTNCTNSTGYSGAIFVLADGGSNIRVGPNVTMNNGYSGVYARFGSYIDASGTKCTGGADGCYWAYRSVLICASCDASGGNSIFSGSGFLLDNQSYGYLSGSCSYSNRNGVTLINNSSAFIGGFRNDADCSGTTHINSNTAWALTNTPIYNFDQAPLSGLSRCQITYTNSLDGTTFVDNGCGVQGAVVSSGNYTQFQYVNGTTKSSSGINKSGSSVYGGDPASGINTTPQWFTSAPGSTPITFGTNTHLAGYFDTDQSLKLVKYLRMGLTTFTTSGCSATSPTGTGTAGKFTSGTTGTCTVTITMNGATGMTAPNGWACPPAADLTTNADSLVQTASTTTTATLSGTTVSGDVISFTCQPY